MTAFRLLLLLTAFWTGAAIAGNPLHYGTHSRIAWQHFDNVTQANNEKKHLFLYFHAQWCTWCRTYQQDTLEVPSVATAIQRRFMPVLVDADRRRDLFTRYGGRGLPFTVIADAQGQTLFRFTGHVAPGDLMDLIQRQPDAPALSPAHPALAPNRHSFLAWLEDLYDPASARFLNPSHIGSTGKRPQPLTLIYLLDEPAWASRIVHMIDALLDDLHDREEGGFYFFADRTRPDLTNPVETSKVLGLNAQVIWLLAEAYQRYGHARWRNAAQTGITYLERVLWDDKAHGFYGSQASDRAYHVLPLSRRKQHPAPLVEKVKYTDSNALTVMALLRAGQVFGEVRHTVRAQRTLAFLERQMRTPDGGYYHYLEAGKPRLAGYLPDQAWALAAHRAMHQQRPPTNAAAIHRLEKVISTYRDPKMGGYFERLPDQTRWKDSTTQSLISWLMATSNANTLHDSELQVVLKHSALADGGQPDDIVLALWAQRLFAARLLHD